MLQMLQVTWFVVFRSYGVKALRDKVIWVVVFRSYIAESRVYSLNRTVVAHDAAIGGGCRCVG